MLAALFLLATDPVLASPSPFSLQLARDSNVLRGSLFNHSEHAHAYLYDPTYQPVSVLVRDETGHYFKVFAPPEPPPRGATPVYRKNYIRLDPRRGAVLDEGSISGNVLERFEIRFGRFHCGYLPAGRYFVSLLWTSADSACFDCTDADKQRLGNAWHGTLRSQEIAVDLR